MFSNDTLVLTEIILTMCLYTSNLSLRTTKLKLNLILAYIDYSLKDKQAPQFGNSLQTWVNQMQQDIMNLVTIVGSSSVM